MPTLRLPARKLPVQERVGDDAPDDDPEERTSRIGKERLLARAVEQQLGAAAGRKDAGEALDGAGDGKTDAEGGGDDRQQDDAGPGVELVRVLEEPGQEESEPDQRRAQE